MKILIIEDEETAVEQLKNMLQQLVEHLDIVGSIDNIEEAVEFLSLHPAVDLIFLDIHLSDGLSFEIFKEVKVEIPVIFTTAYDQYAIQAFEINSIGYLLKPIRKEKLQKALEKFHRMEARHTFTLDTTLLEKITQMITRGSNFRRNFLIPFKNRLIPITTDEIAWFELTDSVVIATKFDNKRFTMDERSLDELAEQLDPALFYRVNRQYLINRKAIREIEFYFNGRLVVKLSPSPDEKVLISKAKVGSFKEWMNQIS